MQQLQDYFYLEQSEAAIKGTCKQFISQDELKWREVDKLQEHPYKRVGKYIRNIQYTSINTRTIDTLKSTLKYLIETIFPLMLKPNNEGLSSQRVAVFLEERLVGIRCEYFVQGIICPKQLLKLLRCLMVVWMIKGITSKNFEMVGLQFLVQLESKNVMESRFPSEYSEALKYAILVTKTSELPKLLSIHQIILNDEEFYRLLALRLKIERSNYQAYFTALSQEIPTLRCVVWLKIDDIKAQFTKIVKKSFGDVKTSWLYKRLCIFNAKPQTWINAKQIPDPNDCKQLSFKEWIEIQAIQQVLA